MIRVLVGEDSYIAREGICRALAEEVDIEVVGTCADLPSLRAAVGEARPDVVLADIRMPPSKTDEGVRLAAELRVSHPKLGLGDSRYVSRRVKAALLCLARSGRLTPLESTCLPPRDSEREAPSFRGSDAGS